MNFRVQRYRGQRVLTWWEGEDRDAATAAGPGDRRPARTGGGAGQGRATGYHSDLHEFIVTRADTACSSRSTRIVERTCRHRRAGATGGSWRGSSRSSSIRRAGCSSSGAPRPRPRSTESLLRPSPAFDYFHLNSIAVDTDGHLLVSARHASAVYKLDRRTGEYLAARRQEERLRDGPGATFNFQHDARRHADGTITVFDNGAFAPPGRVPSSPSRGRCACSWTPAR